MQCENCGERPATIHQTIIINGQKQESHLCEVCAHKAHISGGVQDFPNLSIYNLLSSFMEQSPFGTSMPTMPQQEPRCRGCGMTYSQFAEGGRLGCAQCYTDLEPQLLPLIKRIHGNVAHAGKAPKRTGGVLRKRRDLEALQRQLQAAVAQEKYEEAARLRDQIKALEREIQGGGSANAVE